MLPSLSPRVNSFSENTIQTLPTCVFCYWSRQMGTASQKYEFEKWIPRTNEATGL